MKKTIILGDTHCKTIWRDIVEKEKDADRIIFIGDYFDDYVMTPGEKQMENFKEICKLKEAGDKEVIILIGNHDYHYMNNGTYDCYSGFRKECRIMFNEILTEKEKLMQLAFLDENNTIYSHAGVTNSFLDNWFINSKNPKVVVNALNSMFREHPDRFKFYKDDYSGYGDNINQSPIWVRPASLGKDKIDARMVIGHTKLPEIGHDSKTDVYMIDCLDYSKQYLVCKDGKYESQQL